MTATTLPALPAGVAGRLASAVAHKLDPADPYAAQAADPASLPDRIAGQAIAFVTGCALRPDLPLSPSPLVDLGWHTLILRTRDYAALCDLLGAGFVHHDPCDSPDDLGESLTSTQTAEVLHGLGLPVDEELWRIGASTVNCIGGPDGPGKSCTRRTG